jgi:hypothetical protein
MRSCAAAQLRGRGLRGCHREQGHADGADAGQPARYLVGPLVTLVGQQKHANGAQAAHQHVAHCGVVVGADGVLQAWPLQKHFAQGQQQRQAAAQHADGPAQGHVRQHQMGGGQGFERQVRLLANR